MEKISNLLPLAVTQQNSEPAPPALKPSETGERFLQAIMAQPIRKLTDVESIKQALRAAMLLVGVRANNLPNEEEKAFLLAFVRENYAGHTCQEITLAFNLAVTGKLDLEENEVTCYENFSCQYFGRIMGAYRRYAVELHRQVVKPELPPAEVREDTSEEGMEQWLKETAEKVKAGETAPEFLAPSLYQYAEQKGLIEGRERLWQRAFEKAMERREAVLRRQADNKAVEEFISQKRQGYFTGREKKAIEDLIDQIFLWRALGGAKL